MKCAKYLLLILVFWIPSVVVSAAGKPYAKAGVIDEIRAEEQVIIIDDYLYYIIPQVLVNRGNGQTFGLHNLIEGMPIGFNSKGPSEETWIQEVWILDAPPVPDAELED